MYVKDRKAICLSEEQMGYIYKKVELGSEINADTMKQEIDNEKLTVTKTEEKGINPYIEGSMHNVYKDVIKTVQMEYWSILSNVKYAQHDEESKTTCNLQVKNLDYRHHKKLHNNLNGDKRQMLDMDFGDNPDLLKTNYLNIYEGVHADIVY